jgi:hypothetical protein
MYEFLRYLFLMLLLYANDCSCGFIIAYDFICDNMKLTEKYKFIESVSCDHLQQDLNKET